MPSTIQLHGKVATTAAATTGTVAPKLTKQQQRVMDYLLKRKSITDAIAREFLGISRLAARICELKEYYRFDTVLVERINRYQEKCHVAKYTLLGPVSERSERVSG